MKIPEARFPETEATVPPIVGHEIKSLINAIFRVSESLSAKLNSSGVQDEPYIREYVQLIRCASSSVMPLIDDLVAIGKHQANSATINPLAVYNLRQEFECTRDTFSHKASTKRIDLSLFIADDIPVVYWDIGSLRTHVLNNILSNAIFYTPVGGKVAIHVEKSDDYKMSIKISDSGPGIRATERKNVLGKPPELDKNSNVIGNKRVGGLCHAQLCVQAHKGNISIVDEPGFSGATFKIEIPSYILCMQ